MYYNKIKTV